MAHQDNSDNIIPLFLPYKGTTGYVEGSDTSRERAHKEAATGKSAERLMVVLNALESHPEGLTWKQAGMVLGMHHGQVSGALSVLHKSGLVFQLKEKRDKCHPYVHRNHIDRYHPSQTILSPSMTKAGRVRKAYEDLEAAVRCFLDKDDNMSLAILFDAISRLDDAKKA